MEGKENEFESLFKELAVTIRDHDKECNYYDFINPNNQEPT